MKIICCYSSSVHPKTRQALSLYAPETEYVETKGLFGYGEVITERWNTGEDLVVVEADKEINAETLPSFAGCNKLWCTSKCTTNPAPYTRTTTTSLACTKFSALIQDVVKPADFLGPDPFWAPCRHCDSKGCWRQLDTRLAIAIVPFANGLPCVHGWVEHHHEYDQKWHDEMAKDEEFLVNAFANTPQLWAPIV